MAKAVQPSGEDIAITAVLFNLAATPETPHHGAFLERVVQHARAEGQQILVLLDESGYRARLGDQASGEAQLTQRLALWQAFCQQYQLHATAVDLLVPQRRHLELDTAIHFGGAA